MDTLGTVRGPLGIRGHSLASTGVVDASTVAVSVEVSYSVCCELFVLPFGMWYVPSFWKCRLTPSTLRPCSADLVSDCF